MTTMLEKAAMAAAGVGNGSISPEENWERYTSPAGKERDIERIRAALQAIREQPPEIGYFQTIADAHRVSPQRAWADMIDAILAGEA